MTESLTAIVAAAVVGQGYGQGTSITIGIKGIASRITDGEECLIKEVTATVVPGEVVYLIQVVVVVGRGVMCRHKLLLSHINRRPLSIQAPFLLGGTGGGFPICQEITAGAGIGIPRSGSGGGSLPVDGSDTIEQTAAIDHTGGHFFKVVRLSKIVTRQLFWLQGSAIAIELHLRRIRETCLLDEGIRQLIEARLWDTDLRPGAGLEDRVVGIAIPGRASATGFGNRRGRHIQFEERHFLILSVPVHQRHE